MKAQYFEEYNPDKGCYRFVVPSFSHATDARGRTTKYQVYLNTQRVGKAHATWSCSCPNWFHQQAHRDQYKCKHIEACEEGMQLYLLSKLIVGHLPLSDEGHIAANGARVSLNLTV